MAAICLEQDVDQMPGRLAVVIAVHPPDRKRRDLDNICKCLLDSLEGWAYANDGQIDYLALIRSPVVKGGQVVVTLEAG